MYLRTCEKEASIITTKYVTANGITTTETETGSNRARKQREEIIRGVFSVALWNTTIGSN